MSFLSPLCSTSLPHMGGLSQTMEETFPFYHVGRPHSAFRPQSSKALICQLQLGGISPYENNCRLMQDHSEAGFQILTPSTKENPSLLRQLQLRAGSLDILLASLIELSCFCLAEKSPAETSTQAIGLKATEGSRSFPLMSMGFGSHPKRVVIPSSFLLGESHPENFPLITIPDFLLV